MDELVVPSGNLPGYENGYERMSRHKLTDSKIKGLMEPGIYGDGDGLHLRIQPSGSRSWIFVWKRFGVRREIGLGPYGAGTGHVSLAAARVKAEEARGIVGSGGDPKLDMAERKAALKVISFGQCADEYIEVMKSKWRGAKTLPRWERFAANYAKTIRSIPVDTVVTDDIVRILKPFWRDKPETAQKIRECVKLVLDHAKARGLRSGDNPAQWKGHLDQVLPPPVQLIRGHHPAMPFADVPEFLRKLKAVDGVGAKCLEFTILTAARSGEARGAVWAEIDLDERVWTIPPGRMKSQRIHRVPLSERAVAVLEEMRAEAVGDLVFAGQSGKKPISDMTMAKALKAAGADAVTVHGFRSSFSDWAAEMTTFPRDLVEQALAHAVGDTVERSYRRTDVLERRRALTAAWASFLEGGRGGSVVTLRLEGAHG
jgi:integrase